MLRFENYFSDVFQTVNGSDFNLTLHFDTSLGYQTEVQAHCKIGNIRLKLEFFSNTFFSDQVTLCQCCLQIDRLMCKIWKKLDGGGGGPNS